MPRLSDGSRHTMCTTQGSLSTDCRASGYVVLILCVVLAVSGEASGVDVTQQAGGQEKDTQHNPLPRLHTYTETHAAILPEVTQLADVKIPHY